MEELMRGKIQAYYGTDTKKLYLGDCLELLRKMKPESVDMIFADPPYFLSNNGITCQGGRMVSVNKASWDEGGDFKENHAFNRRWIRMCRRVLKPGGTFLICNESSGDTDKDEKWTEIIGGMTIYSGDELKTFLENAGFCNVQIHKNKMGWLCVTGQKREE